MDLIMKNNIDIIESTRLKVIRLSNQLLVGNFSSPHSFTFEDGSVLPKVSDYDSERLKVNFNETIVNIGRTNPPYNVKTVSLDFTLSDEVRREMEIWEKMWKHNDVHIVLCPLPMIQALNKWRNENDESITLKSPFRAVRMKDRIKKLSSIDTFTI